MTVQVIDKRDDAMLDKYVLYMYLTSRACSLLVRSTCPDPEVPIQSYEDSIASSGTATMIPQQLLAKMGK